MKDFRTWNTNSLNISSSIANWALRFAVIIVAILYIKIFTHSVTTDSFSRILRFLLLPCLLAVFQVFGVKLNYVSKLLPTKLAFLSLCFIFLQALSLKISKYFSNNYDYFDFGLIATKIVKYSNLNFFDFLYNSALVNHFQPIYLLYVLVYRIFGSLDAVLIFQTLVIFSTVIPLWLLGKTLDSNYQVSASLALFFATSPIWQFHDLLGLHADSFIFPAMAWAFYLFCKQRILGLFMILIAICASGQTYIPIAIIFGICVALEQKNNKIKGLLISVFFVLFFIVVIFAHQIFDSTNSINTLIDQGEVIGPFYYLLSNSLERILVTVFTAKRLVLIILVILPFILVLNKIFPFILLSSASLLIIGFSSEPYHFAYDSHYLAPILMTLIFIFYIKLLNLKKEKREFTALLNLGLVVNIFLMLIMSPSIFSLNFVSEYSAGNYNFSKYITSEKKQQLEGYLHKNNYFNKIQSVEISNGAFLNSMAFKESLTLFPSNAFNEAKLIVLEADPKGFGSENNFTKSRENYKQARKKLPNTHDLLFNTKDFQIYVLKPKQFLNK